MHSTNKLKSIWLIWAGSISLIIILIYFITHICYNENGIEEKFLNKDNLSAINSLIAIENDGLPKNDLIIEYLEKLMPMKDTTEISHLVNTYNNKQLIAVLPEYPFKVESFFWLTGSWVLLEVVFWSLFGLIANLMYSVTMAKEFDSSRVHEHIGKIFYTPFLVIIIYLSLNALVNSGSISFEGIGKSTIVLSFVLGFFTRRTIVLLGKIKDLILPTKASSTQEMEEKDLHNNAVG